MGIDLDYFLAEDDGAAARALSRPGGPLGRPEVTGHRKTGLFRREPVVTELGPGYPGFASRGVDPVVALGTLAELLTGVPYDSVQEDPRHGAEIACTPSGDRMVLAVTDGLRAALVTVDDTRLREIAAAWNRTEELADIPPEDLVEFLSRLRDLVRSAGDARLYCHVAL
ncbi:hypothetical protein [Blastococcus montanus]|uniref:hypothetical protein n=1 Tax=Blastococcus montanus TaxID=3144973 RepID=UPI0032093684